MFFGKQVHLGQNCLIESLIKVLYIIEVLCLVFQVIVKILWNLFHFIFMVLLFSALCSVDVRFSSTCVYNTLT